MKKKVLDKISGEEALIILRKLAKEDAKLKKQIEWQAEQLLMQVDIEEICEAVYSDLDILYVEDLWDRSGAHRDYYISPEEMAVEMMESELRPHHEEVYKYLELNMPKEAKLYCMGALKGIYKYEQESKSEFKDWAVDIAQECFGFLLDKWKEKSKSKDDLIEMELFIQKECTKWAKYG